MKSETKACRNRRAGNGLGSRLAGFAEQPLEAPMNPNRITVRSRWMLVDDNENILHMLAAVLAGLTGATIECHATPQAALAAYRQAPGQYELVITDFEMPAMNGVELRHQIHALSPDQKIILATGSGLFTEATADEAGFNALLEKPFPLPQLKAALAKVLGAGVEKLPNNLIVA